VNAEGKLSHRLNVPTLAERGFEASLEQVFAAISQVLSQCHSPDRVRGIGLGAPGPVQVAAGRVVNPPNLPGWNNVPLSRLVEERFSIPARLDNDANAAGLAEVLWGAGKGFHNVLYVTVSTGIGTGIILDRKIYHGKQGYAGEGGHVTIAYDSPLVCGCGNRGCVEVLASGPAMARRLREKLLAGEAWTPILRAETGGDPEHLTAELIGKAAARGDRLALEVVRETGELLGIWLASMISVLDPDAIIIGGGVAQIGEPLFNAIQATIPSRTINRAAANCPVLPAQLVTDVGIYGAASLFLAEG
jgi:glucokinase